MLLAKFEVLLVKLPTDESPVEISIKVKGRKKFEVLLV
jgi:hypothetical protein